MKALTFDEIVAAEDTEVRCVDCPEWGGAVYVRSISADARDRFEMQFADRKGDMVGLRAALVGACMCDETGKLLKLSDAQTSMLGRKSAAVMGRIFDVCLKLNKIGNDDVEKLAGNSEPVDASDSG